MKAILALAGVAVALLGCGSQPGPATAGRSEVPPNALDLVQPAYPEEARKAGVEGTAMVEVTVGADGAVLGCSLATSSDNSLLDEAAVGAARSSKFAPGTRDGKPVEMKVKVPFRFKLEDKPKESRGQVPGGTYWTAWPDEPQCRDTRPSAQEA
jgi:TonB family protein